MGKIDHVGKYKEIGFMIDSWECSCGWVSRPYFDGEPYARAEFNAHVDAAKARPEVEKVKRDDDE